ncbi:MAG: PAS domain S-box protein [Hyphomicrobium sp.]|nr:PAS domain S-box protein [Hyphomicrobium sp.]
MASRSTSLPRRILLSCLFVILALITRVTVLPDLADRPTYVPFHVAVVLAAVFGGTAGCLTAAILSVVIAHSLFVPLNDAVAYAMLATFLGTAVLLTLLLEALLTAQHRWLAAQQSLASDVHLRLFIEQAPVSMAMFDRDMRYLAVSRRWLADYQIAEPNITGRSHYEIFPNLPDRLREIHRRALAGETLCSDCDEFTLNNGTIRWERWEVLPWRLEDGRVGGITIFTDDITDRVQAEYELRESKKQLNRAQSVARVGNWRMVFATDALQGSAQTFDILGQPAHAQLSFQMLLDLVHPDDRDRVSAIRKTALKGETYDIEYRFVVADKVGWMRERSEPEFNQSGQLVGAFGVIQDITDRKTIEHDLRSSEERLRLALDAAGMAVWDLDIRTGHEVWNDQCYRMLGYEPGEIDSCADAWMRHVHPEERTMISESFNSSLAHGTEISNEHRIIDRNGVQKWVSVRGRVACDAVGRPIRSFGVITDITERKRAEERDRLLTLEVNHRAKNLLAVVQAVAFQTARQHEGPQFVDFFNKRIESLAASHDLLVNSKWQGVAVASLVRAQLAHFDGLIGTRIQFSGPDAGLSPEAAQAIGLALHELVTNASKYGALSNAEGVVAIKWNVEHLPTGQRFKMSWCETGGPLIKAPKRHGFGHSVLVNMAEYALAGRVSLTYPPEGLQWQLDAPAEVVLRPTVSSGPHTNAEYDNRVLAG